ncbi:MAG: glycosyltransferase family 4 protein [Cytophagaceae bacterium]|jgi:glycosyltransferase involved in cell wall biosynthesis|nr:glycosyltransferase family 4 protein [Cytophagaceae bacterium]
MKPFFQIEYILLDNNNKKSPFEEFLKNHNIKCYRLHLTNNKLNWALNALKVFNIFKRTQPKLVHCHLLEAGLIGIITAKISGIKIRIYTRHYSDIHHVFFPKGIIYDRIINQLSTHIGSVSNIVTELLIQKENIQPKKIIYTPNFFNLKTFNKSTEEDKLSLKTKYKIPKDTYIIGVISRLTEWKGVEYIVAAFIQYVNYYDNNACLCLLNAIGDRKEEILNKLKCLEPKNYRIIEFEENISSMYEIFDVFVHVPTNKYHEAFGQVYIEALASKIPCIFTISGVANDFVENCTNAIVVDYKSSDQIYNGLKYIRENPDKLKPIIENGYNSIKKYDYLIVAEELKIIYQNLLLQSLKSNTL